MPTIQIHRAGFFNKKPFSEHIEADVFGVFAIHPSPGLTVGDDEFNLTHVPTGFAYLTGVSRADAEAALRDIIADTDVDWTAVKTVKDVTAAHKIQGKAICAKYEDAARVR